MLKKVISTPNFRVKYDQIKAQASYIPECPEGIEIRPVMVEDCDEIISAKGSNVECFAVGSDMTFIL